MVVLKGNQHENFIFEKKTAVALGSFDALHKGHTAVIGAAVSYARENGLLSLVQLVEIPNTQRINSFEKRLEILEEMGVDAVIAEEFSPEFRSIDYKSFVAHNLFEKYNAAAVFSGENYRFGHGAEGDVHKLREECLGLGIKVFVKDCVCLDTIVSSTEIRRLVSEGKMEKVTEYMGRPFSVCGKVVHGRELGRRLGFPTANIGIPENIIMPKDGVYLSRVSFDGTVFFGVTNIGAKPTVDVAEKNIETYISDYKGDIYGKVIEVEFLKKLRDIKKFDTVDGLRKQLVQDEIKARSIAEETEFL